MQNKIKIYQSQNSSIEFNGDIQHETLWASLNQIAELFGRDKSVISRHIEYFNLDMIISIGYRVDSKEAITFRKWATSILKTYLIHEKDVIVKLIKYLIFDKGGINE